MSAIITASGTSPPGLPRRSTTIPSIFAAPAERCSSFKLFLNSSPVPPRNARTRMCANFLPACSTSVASTRFFGWPVSDQLQGDGRRVGLALDRELERLAVAAGQQRLDLGLGQHERDLLAADRQDLVAGRSPALSAGDAGSTAEISSQAGLRPVSARCSDTAIPVVPPLLR
jgi:hypothetical protein